MFGRKYPNGFPPSKKPKEPKKRAYYKKIDCLVCGKHKVGYVGDRICNMCRNKGKVLPL